MNSGGEGRSQSQDHVLDRSVVLSLSAPPNPSLPLSFETFIISVDLGTW